ncbi:tumor necrosis factor ligand superfamily member 15-like isoform X2 [Mercenaria mercenaria]|uniref:tumor necrosis factor ligand superfamily member 15-like isoform X2 n=1 Tax=Mercenaria mercenaria TaxID=6596 RepID=UPI00234F5B3C|nr:tumor necrosis factor ligand superfamily member 15-like isoform X2 [Mercenaria mercenaria]
MDNRLKLPVIAVLVSVFVCLVTVLALLWTMPELPTAMGQDQICLPNKAGYLNCGFTADLLHDYLERVVTKVYDEIDTHEQTRRRETCKKAKRQCGNMKPAAKLTGTKQTGTLNKNDIESDMTTVREWRHGKELYETSGLDGNGIRYRNGRLVVPVDGTYFVHSFFELLEPCDPSTGRPNVKDPTKPIKHGVFKFNIFDKEEIEVVSNVQPHAVSQSNHFNLYNSYVSSLVELKAGDELSVKISNITYLKYTPDNYFGVHLI